MSEYSRNKYGQNSYGRSGGRRKKHRVWLYILLIILLLICGGAAFVLFELGRIEHVSLGDLSFNTGVGTAGGYRNVVLYGVDSREGALTESCHSDTIIICSLNEKTREVKLVSVYRDTYLDNTNGEYRKATECYFFGGPQRSVNMLNRNLDLNITDYVAVNFNVVVEAVDLLGGIDLEITEEEMGYINGYCVENSQVTGVSYTPLDTWGNVHLDGIQTLAYCRIRYTEGWDYKRTERQRTVLNLLFQKAKQQKTSGILAMVNLLLPEISTSLGTTEILSLASAAGSYSLTDQTGFPFDKTALTLSSAGDCVIPVNLAANVTQLHAFLYNEDNYIPSDTVQAISAQITADTGV